MQLEPEPGQTEPQTADRQGAAEPLDGPPRNPTDLRTYVWQSTEDRSLSLAQWKRARSERLHREKQAATSSEPPKAVKTFSNLPAAAAEFARASRLTEPEGRLVLFLASEVFEECRRNWEQHAEPDPKRPWDPKALLKVLSMCANVSFSDEKPPDKAAGLAAHQEVHLGESPDPGSEPFVNLSPRLRSDEPCPVLAADYEYHGPQGWFAAELLFDADHPSRPRERWNWLLSTWLPKVRDAIEAACRDPAGTPEARIKPSSVVFESSEYSNWASFQDKEGRRRLFHFRLEERACTDPANGSKSLQIMAIKSDFSDKRTDGFNGQFIDRELPDFQDREVIYWGTFGLAEKYASEDGMIFNAPLASAMRHFKELFALNDIEVSRFFRSRRSWHPHRPPIYVAAMGAAFRAWKLAARLTADFASPRNHRLSAQGLPFGPNDAVDMADTEKFPEHPYVHIKEVLPNVSVLLQAHQWIRAQDPAAAQVLLPTGIATDISAYFRWIKKRAWDSWRQAIFVLGEDGSLQFNDSDSSQFGETQLPSYSERISFPLTGVVRKYMWKCEARLWEIAADPSHPLAATAGHLCPAVLRDWYSIRSSQLGPSSESSEIAQDRAFFTEQCIDDRLGATLGPFRAALMLFLAVLTFELAGLEVNTDKNQLGHSLEWLGLWIFLKLGVVALTESKTQLIKDWTARVLEMEVTEHDEVESLVGFFQYASVVKPSAALFLRRAYKFLHISSCWSFLEGRPGLAHRWTHRGQWFARDIEAACELILRADGIALIKQPRNLTPSLHLDLTSDSNRNYKKLHLHSGAGGALALPSRDVITYSFTFKESWVIWLPVHILEAVNLPIQEKLFLNYFQACTTSKEWCDNSPSVSAFDLMKPSDLRMLFLVLERDDILDISPGDSGRIHTVEFIRSRDNLYADLISRNHLEQASQRLSADGFRHIRHIHLESSPLWPYACDLLDRLVAFTRESSDPLRSVDRLFGTC